MQLLNARCIQALRRHTSFWTAREDQATPRGHCSPSMAIVAGASEPTNKYPAFTALCKQIRVLHTDNSSFIASFQEYLGAGWCMATRQGGIRNVWVCTWTPMGRPPSCPLSVLPTAGLAVSTPASPLGVSCHCTQITCSACV